MIVNQSCILQSIDKALYSMFYIWNDICLGFQSLERRTLIYINCIKKLQIGVALKK